MIQIHANCSKFVRNSYEFRTKFVTTTFTVRIHGTLGANFVRNSYEIRTNFVRISHEFRTNFLRISCELRTNFVPFLQDTARRATPTPPMHATKSPHPHTFPCTCPPRHTHPHKHTHTHTHTNIHTHTHTHAQNTHIPSMKAKSPQLDPHPHTARPHTLIRTWTVDVSRLDV